MLQFELNIKIPRNKVMHKTINIQSNFKMFIKNKIKQ